MIRRRGSLLTAKQLSTAIWIALLGYLILVGGMPGGEFNGWIRAVNGTIAAVLIVRWVAALPSDHDGTDRGMLWALLAFLAACVASDFPRQSFDAAIQVTALAAGFYFARRRLATEVRAGIESAAAWLCVGLSAIVCLAWGLGWADWLIVSGGSAPPLNIPLATWPFAHRHDVALLVALLAPAMWSSAFRRRRSVAIVGTALAAAVVLADSSRNIELAVLGSSFAVVVGYRIRIGARRLRIAAVIAAATALAGVAVVLASPVLLSRIANVGTLLARVSLWTEALGVWLAHPLAGIGPGAFPFSYMLSDHFRVSLFDPRHPDNAAVQLLVEGGIIGLAAALVCAATLIRGAQKRYRGEPAAVWALLFFALATLGANPTDFVFLLVPALIWAAILVPGDSAVPSTEMPRGADIPRARMKVVLASAAAVMVVAVSVTGAGSISYEMGRDAYLRGDSATAESALDVSAALDPSLSIYRRERASLAFARGDWTGAAAGYRQSLAISPYDPVAWRGLALALLANSDVPAAIIAAENATDLMFLSPENQLVRAATAEADPTTFGTAVRIALRSAPQLAIISWDDTILDFADRVGAARQAVDAEPSAEGDEVFIGQVLLALIANRADAAAAAAERVDPLQRRAAAALAAVAACDIERASRLVDEAARVDGEQGWFWIARSIVSGASGVEHERIVALSLRFLGLSSGPGPEVVSALTGDISDRWRYRRNSLGVVARGAGLPSGNASMWTLLTDPADALAQVGTGWPPGCVPHP